MKQFLFLLALIAVAFAAPSDRPDGLLDVNDPGVIANGSRSLERAVGFGSFHGGVHGGAGGAIWTVWDPWALRDALNSNERRIVYLRGRVDVIALFTGSPGVRLSVGSYTSLIGGDSNAEISGGGLIVSGVRQVIIQNIKVINALSFAAGEQPNGNGGIISMVPGDYSSIDNIGIDRNSENVWVDHCVFADDPWVAGVGPRRHDGLIDITRGASYVTVSNSIFRNHNLVSLIGNGVDMGHEDAGRLRVTFFGNWFRGTIQRNPYVRFGQVHILNNLYEDITDYGIGAGIHSQLFVERNVFVNCRTNRGAISSTNVSPRGQIANSVNLFRSCNFDNNLPALTNWNPFYDSYNYRAIPIGDVENHVRRYAGTCASSDGLEGRTEDSQFPTAAALRQSPLMQHCPLKGTPKCPTASKRYRTHDGTCNNINRPRWGSTMTPVQRFLSPTYSDGLQAPRRSVFGGQLPSAREISALVHESKNVESPGITHLLMQWGQFLDHDVTSSSQSRGFNGSVPRCCRDGGRDFVPKELMHPECFPIAVPPSDPFYGPRRVRCLDFVRSSPAPRDDCALGWREQLNQVSAYIDGSPVYASSARQSDKLRLFRNGMLQYGRVQQRRPVLPPERRDELCRGGAVSTECFKSGDGRVNEHPGLVAAHIVWLRHHNRMAQELAHLNPHWSDEKIYQETRKIVGAMIQQITYREFLPIVLGADVMEIFELDLLKKGYFKEYNPKINPSPASSFGSAAFRFGHSLVQPSMMRFDRFHRPMHNNVTLHNELTNPSNIWSIGAVDRLLLGMVNQPIQKRDEFITEELTNHLFQTPQFDFGMDLAAINIQRGRDHGVPPYTVWREPCGLSAILEFDDLVKVMPARAVRKLKVLYRHVDDIDLFTGGMAERPVMGGLVGPTFACIIAQQFSNLRRGDRFWYENGGFESSFTPAQLQQLRRISFAQVLCRTLDSIDSIQPFAFLSADHSDNDRISCQNGILNNFDLSPWIEIDSEFDNDIKKSENVSTQKPKRKKPTTSKPSTTTKAVKNSIKNTKKPQIKVSSTTSAIERKTDNVNATTKENIDSNNDTLTNKMNKTNMTVQIDDKLDFKNKTKRLDDTDIDFRNRPTKQYSTDYDDDEDLSVQSVVINNSGYNKRPYNYKRPILTVTENTNKYTYLINYVPRPTESYRHTTRRAPERDVVKVTYQTYDDTYRRPSRPSYYYNRDETNNKYRHNRPNRRTTVDDNYMHSSARSNNNIEKTTTKPKMTTRTDDVDKYDKIDKTHTTTENLYKLVTFGYVGSYRGDAADQLNMKLDKVLSPKPDDMTSKTDEMTSKTDEKTSKTDDMTSKTDDMASKTDDLPLIDKADEKHRIISKDFSTYTTKPGLTKDKTDISKDKTDFTKLSTFFTYETSTKSYQQRSTRLNDDNYNPYLYPKNNIYRQTDTDREFISENPKIIKEIIKENYNNPGIPQVNIEERSSLDIMAEEHDTVSKSAVNKLRIKVRRPAGPAQTPSVAFQVIPSEVNPTQWAVYDEDLDLPEVLPLQMPPIRTDPHALKEIPRPISLIGLRRRRPGRF